MRTIAVWALLLAAFEAQAFFDHNRSLVRGELTWTPSGIAKVVECQTGRRLEVGTLASAPYGKLRREYDELSSQGTAPVLLEIVGNVAVPSSNPQAGVIASPRVQALRKGGCGQP